jgi:hypothetical protein
MAGCAAATSFDLLRRIRHAHLCRVDYRRAAARLRAEYAADPLRSAACVQQRIALIDKNLRLPKS